MMRTITVATGVACMAILVSTALPVSAEESETLPAGCNDEGTTTVFAGTTAETDTFDLGQESGFDPDCVVLTFTKTPPSPTTDTNAEITWSVKIFGLPQEFSDWAEWENKTCTLDGAKVDCEQAASLIRTGLTPGEHVFTVEAETPSLFQDDDGCGGQCDRESVDAATVKPPEACAQSFEEIPGRPSCVKVSGEVRWTVQAPQATTTPAPETVPTPTPAPAPVAAPVAAAATPPAPRVCTSRRTVTIRLRERSGERISSARVVFNGRTIATSRRTSDGRVVAKLDFRTLPSGRFSVQIRAKLSDGKTRTFTRRYFTCERKLEPSNRLESPKAL